MVTGRCQLETPWNALEDTFGASLERGNLPAESVCSSHFSVSARSGRRGLAAGWADVSCDLPSGSGCAADGAHRTGSAVRASELRRLLLAPCVRSTVARSLPGLGAGAVGCACVGRAGRPSLARVGRGEGRSRLGCGRVRVRGRRRCRRCRCRRRLRRRRAARRCCRGRGRPASGLAAGAGPRG